MTHLEIAQYVARAIDCLVSQHTDDAHHQLYELLKRLDITPAQRDALLSFDLSLTS